MFCSASQQSDNADSAESPLDSDGSLRVMVRQVKEVLPHVSETIVQRDLGE